MCRFHTKKGLLLFLYSNLKLEFQLNLLQLLLHYLVKLDLHIKLRLHQLYNYRQIKFHPCLCLILIVLPKNRTLS